MVRHLNTNYPAEAEPEDIALQEAVLREGWDANNDIENLFQSKREGCETLLAMGAITRLEIDKTFIKYVYLAIRGSGQFEKACFKWRALPAADKQTATQIRTFFSKKYNKFYAKQNALYNASVANLVRLQEILQATNDRFIIVRDRQEDGTQITSSIQCYNR